jgi:hypothetical protein
VQTIKDIAESLIPSEFLATFSIERKALVNPDTVFGESPKKMRRLELRRPQEDETKEPFFKLDLDLPKMRKQEIEGVTFDDFVFEITVPRER